MDPGVPDPGDEPIQVPQAAHGRPGGGWTAIRATWLARSAPGTGHPRRVQDGRGVALAQHGQHPAHLVQGVPAGGLDRAQRFPGPAGLAVDHVLAEARLHGDHGHAVRHHVVQFPGDAQPFLGHRLAGRLLLQAAGVGPPLPGHRPERPEHDQQQADRDQRVRGDAAQEGQGGLQGQGDGQGRGRHQAPVGHRHRVQHVGGGKGEDRGLRWHDGGHGRRQHQDCAEGRQRPDPPQRHR